LNRDDYVPQKPIASMSYGQRLRVARLYQSHEEILGQVIRVGGWSKSVRKQANMVFIALNDGSCFSNLQVVVDKTAPGFAEAEKSIVGASYMFTGLLIKSPAKGQPFELAVTDVSHNVTVCGHSDGTYPIQGRPSAEVSLNLPIFY
jgi:asparaginyl-tRNA synthetase